MPLEPSQSPQSDANGSDEHTLPMGGHEASDGLREPGQAPEDTAEENGPPGKFSGSRDAWWRRLVELAAVIAVPPALFYVLGLGALWVQLSSEDGLAGNDNAWFAASLVARPTAAGLGVEVVLRGLFASSAVATAVLVVAYVVLRLFKQGRSDRWRPRLPHWLLPVIVGSLSSLLFIVVSVEGRAPLVPTFRIVSGLAVLYFFTFFLSWSLGAETRAIIKRAFTFYPRWLYSVIAMLSVLCMGGSVLFPGEARLPCLYRETVEGDVIDGEVISAQRAEELRDIRILEGGFLGHSAGHWYVLDSEHLDLQAIPDDEASRALEGEFYVAHTRIGSEGRPVGEPVTEEGTRSGETYTLSGGCNPPTQ